MNAARMPRAVKRMNKMRINDGRDGGSGMRVENVTAIGTTELFFAAKRVKQHQDEATQQERDDRGPPEVDDRPIAGAAAFRACDSQEHGQR
jgi:hypothetical protein